LYSWSRSKKEEREGEGRNQKINIYPAFLERTENKLTREDVTPYPSQYGSIKTCISK
jgi:hypothetical protein